MPILFHRFSWQRLSFFLAAKAKGSHLRVHFKNTREAANAIKHMHLRRAVRFLKNVINKKEIVPYTRFRGDVGRKAQVSMVIILGLEVQTAMACKQIMKSDLVKMIMFKCETKQSNFSMMVMSVCHGWKTADFSFIYNLFILR